MGMKISKAKSKILSYNNLDIGGGSQSPLPKTELLLLKKNNFFQLNTSFLMTDIPNMQKKKNENFKFHLLPHPWNFKFFNIFQNFYFQSTWKNTELNNMTKKIN